MRAFGSFTALYVLVSLLPSVLSVPSIQGAGVYQPIGARVELAPLHSSGIAVREHKNAGALPSVGRLPLGVRDISAGLSADVKAKVVAAVEAKAQLNVAARVYVIACILAELEAKLALTLNNVAKDQCVADVIASLDARVAALAHVDASLAVDAQILAYVSAHLGVKLQAIVSVDASVKAKLHTDVEVAVLAALKASAAIDAKIDACIKALLSLDARIALTIGAKADVTLSSVLGKVFNADGVIVFDDSSAVATIGAAVDAAVAINGLSIKACATVKAAIAAHLHAVFAAAVSADVKATLLLDIVATIPAFVEAAAHIKGPIVYTSVDAAVTTITACLDAKLAAVGIVDVKVRASALAVVVPTLCAGLKANASVDLNTAHLLAVAASIDGVVSASVKGNLQIDAPAVSFTTKEAAIAIIIAKLNAAVAVRANIQVEAAVAAAVAVVAKLGAEIDAAVSVEAKTAVMANIVASIEAQVATGAQVAINIQYTTLDNAVAAVTAAAQVAVTVQKNVDAAACAQLVAKLVATLKAQIDAAGSLEAKTAALVKLIASVKVEAAAFVKA